MGVSSRSFEVFFSSPSPYCSSISQSCAGDLDIHKDNAVCNDGSTTEFGIEFLLGDLIISKKCFLI